MTATSIARPIIFNETMVRALLDGRKTQTRRPIKNQPKNGWVFDQNPVLGKITSTHPKRDKFGAFISRTSGNRKETDIITCPFGAPGDRLWVREKFKAVASGSIKDGCGQVRYGWAYAADSAVLWNATTTTIHAPPRLCSDSPLQFRDLPWKPSIHMPRKASRLLLEITDIRVEKVQGITKADAAAEGFDLRVPAEEQGDWVVGARTNFRHAWQQIYGSSWDNNDWVWVIEFKKVS